MGEKCLERERERCGERDVEREEEREIPPKSSLGAMSLKIKIYNVSMSHIIVYT